MFSFFSSQPSPNGIGVTLMAIIIELGLIALLVVAVIIAANPRKKK